MSRELRDQVVLVTGACGGIGSVTARRLTAAGARVVVTDVDQAAVDRLVDELGPTALGAVLDVTDAQRCRDVVAEAVATHGRFDILWSNAGVSTYGPLDLVPDDEWMRLIAINLTGARNIVAAALPAIMQARGYVALTCSWASFAHQPGHTAYAASKAGLEAMGNALRTELAGTGVRVGTLHPGWIDTSMVAGKLAEQSDFRVLMDALPGPFGTVSGTDDLARAIVTALRRRSSRMVHPRVGWVLAALRPALVTAPFTAHTRAAAPEIRRSSLVDRGIDEPAIGHHRPHGN